MARRTSGSIRQLPSGRWQARTRDLSSGRLVSLGTFATKTEADDALSAARTDQARGAWVKPSDGRITLADWTEEWWPTTEHLRPKTRVLYRYLLDRHILPDLGSVQLVRLDTLAVKRWLAKLPARGLSESTRSKLYRLLRQILAAAVESDRLAKNPCTVKGAGREPTTPLRCPTVEQVLAIAEEIDDRYRAMVLVAGFGGLRLGECAGLRRCDVDPLRQTITVSIQLLELSDGTVSFAAPKTQAGLRTIHIPKNVADALTDHLARFAEPGRTGLLFTSPTGGPLRGNNFRSRFWRPAVRAADLEGLRFHDLRHAAATFAAVAGATTKELMSRIGHASPAAALRYQHALEGRDLEIASRLDVLMNQAIAPTASGEVVPLERPPRP